MGSTEVRASDPAGAPEKQTEGGRPWPHRAARERRTGRRSLPAWLVFAAALLTSLASAFVIAELRGRADEHRQHVLAHQDLHTQAYRTSALEWQAVAEGRLTPEVAEQVRVARGRMLSLMDEVGRPEKGGQEEDHARQVFEAFRAYDAALDEEFGLLTAGRVQEAEAVDEERVDPGFERLRGELQGAVASDAADARRADRLADAGSVLTLLVSAALVAWLYRWYEGARRAAAAAAAEQNALRKSEEAFRYQALHDPLTNLPNRTLLMDRLEHALARAGRGNDEIAVLFVDLDDFKLVNDSLGHKEGDRLLVAASGRLQECLRLGDTLARFGGDEFAILLEDIAGVDEASEVAGRIAERLHAPFALRGQEVFVKASIGIVSGPLDGHSDPDDLLRHADAAMYEAKRKGKADYEVFHPGMGSRAAEHLQLAAEMNRAVERGEFRVHYQPVVELDTGRIGEVEALVRWEHPERGLLLPGEFLALAEETGLILPIGRFVLREACRQAREWQGRYPLDPPLVLGVNLSARQFRQPDLAGEIAEALEETGLDARSLKLEITESIAVEDVESTVSTLRELKEMGVALAVDDFGTGYSSLSYIKRFPIDVLKIARPFVEGLGRDPEDTALVRATVAFAKAFKLDVTGEGIETAEQLAQLRALGCDTGQGYYFAGPLPGEAVGGLFSVAQDR